MSKKILLLALLLTGRIGIAQAGDYFQMSYGELLAGSTEKVGLWWASSGWKIGPDKPLPGAKGRAMRIRTARNEVEAAQLVVRPTGALNGLTLRIGELTGPGGALIPAESLEVLEVRYVNVEKPTDKSATTGLWPDPLLPLKSPIDLEPNKNQSFWVRVKAPRNTPAGIYKGRIKLRARDYNAQVTLHVEVYDFTLPDRMTCTTAFGFSPGNVFRYQKLSEDEHKRRVLDKYWANLSAHHISPYDPAPLDRTGVTWPDVKPPVFDKFAHWQGLRIVQNETHTGNGAALIYDDDPQSNITLSYEPLIRIPKGGLHVRFWYRTAVPEHRFGITLNHYDKDGQWMSGRNNDMTLKGDGAWQLFETPVKDFPKGAAFVRPMIRATTWTDKGEQIGLVWFDDVSMKDTTGDELLEGGDFDVVKRTELVVPVDKLKVTFDFSAWDRATARAIDHYRI